MSECLGIYKAMFGGSGRLGETSMTTRLWILDSSKLASEDHRGTPDAPGRVATLIDKKHWESLVDHVSMHDSAPERVWGAAYHIPEKHVPEVRDYLDIREINGYSMQYSPFQPASGSPPINCLVYIGLPSNPQFLGPQDPTALAKHILKSKGPSGPNDEYLYMLEQALNELSAESGDDHISDLARKCRELEALGYGNTNDDDAKQAADRHAGEHLHNVGGTEVQEEVEK